MTADVRLAYEAAGNVWGVGPSRVYGELARPLLEAAGDVAGRYALDVGTGAGVVARALAARGAQVVASDLALSMLTHDAGTRSPAVVGDVLALPFRTGVFDIAVAAFVLNHLAVPAAGLKELARVARPGGVLLATSFEGQPTHPVKTVVDQAAQAFGFSAPAWYVAMQRDRAPAVGSAEAFARVARDAGLDAVEVTRVLVRVQGLTARDLVDWRLGMAHLAGFVARLTPAGREDLCQQAISALPPELPPLELPVLVLRARC